MIRVVKVSAAVALAAALVEAAPVPVPAVAGQVAVIEAEDFSADYYVEGSQANLAGNPSVYRAADAPDVDVAACVGADQPSTPSRDGGFEKNIKTRPRSEILTFASVTSHEGRVSGPEFALAIGGWPIVWVFSHTG